MTTQEAKQIRLADYLQSLGHSPIKQQGKSLWYKSPFREETEASFKVNTELNQWYDFGIGKGGNIIALAEELYQTDNVSYLLECISKQTPHIRTTPASFADAHITNARQSEQDSLCSRSNATFSFGRQSVQEPMYRHLQVRELSSPALLSYLQEREINIELAKRECKELHFDYKGRSYFAIGFPNMAGGYEVRNRHFKGCVAPKDITHIRQQGEQPNVCYLFEGFMDYLSFLTMRVNNNPQHPRLTEQDYMVLNSVSNLARAENILGAYARIGSFLDNDTAGQTAFQTLQAKFGGRLQDMSQHYQGHKDLNDYLCNNPQPQSAEPMNRKPQVPSVRRIKQPPKKKRGMGL